MKKLLILLLIVFVYSCKITPMEQPAHLAKFDYARNYFTQQPLCLAHFASKKIATIWASCFENLNGKNVDAFAQRIKSEFQMVPVDMHVLLEKQLLLQAGMRGYISNYKTPLQNKNSCLANNYTVQEKKKNQLSIKKKLPNNTHSKNILSFGSNIADYQLSPNNRLLLVALEDSSLELIDLDSNSKVIFSPSLNAQEIPFYNLVRFIDDTTFVTCPCNGNQTTITVWRIVKNHVEKIDEESFEIKFMIYNQRLLFIDEKNSVWCCQKDINGKFFEKISEFPSTKDLFEMSVSSNKQDIVIANPFEPKLYLMHEFKGALKLVKKIWLNVPEKNRRISLLNFDDGYIHYLEREDKQTLTSAGIASSNHISFAVDQEIILNCFEDPFGDFQPLIDQPWQAIVATVACANSNDLSCLEFLENSHLVKDLPENYREHIKENIKMKKSGLE